MLRDKFMGCIAASWIGSSMGAVVEGWSRERIKEKYGFFDKLDEYRHYVNVTDWTRMPGTTEDGIERQKLMATAIIEKKGRILAHDLLRVWLRDLDPAKMIYKQERFDRSLLELARAGTPPSELGRLWPFPNVNSVARASHVIGLINAGDPEGAADDTYEIGKLYAAEHYFSLRWAALYNAAIAEACKPECDRGIRHRDRQAVRSLPRRGRLALRAVRHDREGGYACLRPRGEAQGPDEDAGRVLRLLQQHGLLQLPHLAGQRGRVQGARGLRARPRATRSRRSSSPATSAATPTASPRSPQAWPAL